MTPYFPSAIHAARFSPACAREAESVPPDTRRAANARLISSAEVIIVLCSYYPQEVVI
jgi:hypothetical protein